MNLVHYSFLVLAAAAIASYRWQLLGFKWAIGGLAIVVLAWLLVALGSVFYSLFMRERGVFTDNVQVLVLSLLPIATTVALLWAINQVPAIADISTDTDDPPVFVRALALRQPTDNPLGYSIVNSGKQRDAYPDIQPLVIVDGSFDRVFSRVQHIVSQRGWVLIHQERAKGVLEAYATSPVFGFVDDISIRLRQTPEGVIVDVRSASRVGLSDFGANAKRIRGFLHALSEDS